jgi:SAM-dependent methyltransferase
MNWWDQHIVDKNRVDEFKAWIGPETAPDRVAAHRAIFDWFAAHPDAERRVLDVGCGLCVDAAAFQLTGIAYEGIDGCEGFVEKARTRGLDVHVCDIVHPPGRLNRTWPVLYARHVLEHLDDFVIGLDNMIRRTHGAVFVIFYRPPLNTPDERSSYDGIPTNRYDLRRIVAFLDARKDVARWDWDPDQNLLTVEKVTR